MLNVKLYHQIALISTIHTCAGLDNYYKSLEDKSKPVLTSIISDMIRYGLKMYYNSWYGYVNIYIRINQNGLEEGKSGGKEKGL